MKPDRERHLPMGGSKPGTPGHPGRVHDCARCLAYVAAHPAARLPWGPPATSTPATSAAALRTPRAPVRRTKQTAAAAKSRGRAALAQPSRVAAYVRVSSRSQGDELQRSSVEGAAAARGETIARWYAETRSAKTMARAELQRLRTDVGLGLVRTLYVFKLDRLV